MSTIFRHPLSGLFDLSGTADCWFAEMRLKIKPQPRCWAFISVTKHVVHASLVRTCSRKGRPPWCQNICEWRDADEVAGAWNVLGFCGRQDAKTDDGATSFTFIRAAAQIKLSLSDTADIQKPSFVLRIQSDSVCRCIYLCFLTVSWLLVVFNCRIAEKRPEGP